MYTQKQKLCSRRRALKVVVGLITLSLLLGGVQIKLVTNSCPGQQDTPDTFDKAWSIVTEGLIVLVVPSAVLVLNVLLIRKLHRLAQTSSYLGRQRHHSQSQQPANPATDRMLLSISFYLILISIPLSAVFITTYFISEDAFPTAKFVIDNVCTSLYATNFVIYLVTGRTFRAELFALCRCGRSVSDGSRRTSCVVTSFIGSSEEPHHL